MTGLAGGWTQRARAVDRLACGAATLGSGSEHRVFQSERLGRCDILYSRLVSRQKWDSGNWDRGGCGCWERRFIPDDRSFSSVFD
jgi:hypothetical protein